MPKTVECLFHSDPGHGWLEVPLVMFLQSGAKISDVSPYSYCGLKGFAIHLYLEEDCDIGVFLDAAKAKGWEVKMPHVIHQGECFVRQLPDIPFQQIKAIAGKAGYQI